MEKESQLDSDFEGVIKIVKNKVTLAAFSITASSTPPHNLDENCRNVCVMWDADGDCIEYDNVCDIVEPSA